MRDPENLAEDLFPLDYEESADGVSPYGGNRFVDDSIDRREHPKHITYDEYPLVAKRVGERTLFVATGQPIAKDFIIETNR